MTDKSDFADLVRRLRLGDERAAADIVETFGQQILRTIRHRLTDPRLQPRFGDSDVAQDVFAEFFVLFDSGKYQSLESPTDLLKLLRRIAQHRAINQAKHSIAEIRDVRRDKRSESESMTIPGSGPTPSEIVTRAELLAKCQERMSDAENALLLLWAEDQSWSEIGKAVGKSPDAARMHVNRLIDRLRAELSNG